MKLLSSIQLYKPETINLYSVVSLSLFALDLIIFLYLQFYRFVNPLYLNESANFLFYLGLIASASFHLIYLSVDKKKLLPVLMFAKFLAIFLCFYSGLLPYSIFLLASSLYISFLGLVYSAVPALLFGVFISFLLTLNIVFNAIVDPTILWGQFVFSHFLFFATAYLSPFIIKKIELNKKKLEQKKQDVFVLQNLNKLIVDNIKAGLLTINSALVISSANKKACELLENSYLENCDLLAFFPDISKKINLLFINSNKDKQISSCVFEEVYNKKHFEVLISSLDYGLSKKQIYTLLIQDITEKKRKEKINKQKDKLAIVGSLSASIAHEIRNPLAGISGAVQILKGSKDLDTKESKSLFSMISKEVNRLNSLITEFLDYSVEKPLLLSTINLSEMIKDILKLLQMDKNYSSDIKQILNLKNSIFVQGDALRLKQSLLNFFINAYQAMKNIDKPELFVKTYFKSSYAVIEIKDNGCGMDEKDKLKIFEPFFTKKENGTGLGLATSYNILQQHNCKISVETKIDEGTLFTLKFPAFKYSSPEQERMKVA